MPGGKKFTAEQVIGKLHEAEVVLAQWKTVPEAVRKLGVTEQTPCRSKRGYVREFIQALSVSDCVSTSLGVAPHVAGDMGGRHGATGSKGGSRGDGQLLGGRVKGRKTGSLTSWPGWKER